MFHKYSGRLTAVVVLFCIAAHPVGAHADGAKSYATQAQAQPAKPPAAQKPARLKELSISDMRWEAKTKLSETRQWVKDQKIVAGTKELFQHVGTATDRLQDEAKPAGRSLKSFIMSKLPGKNLAHEGDRTYSVYGLLLMMAFGIVIYLMGMASPASRLGGRH